MMIVLLTHYGVYTKHIPSFAMVSLLFLTIALFLYNFLTQIEVGICYQTPATLSTLSMLLVSGTF